MTRFAQSGRRKVGTSFDVRSRCVSATLIGLTRHVVHRPPYFTPAPAKRAWLPSKRNTSDLRRNASVTHAADKMVCCSAVGCSERGGNDIKLHAFPAEAQRRKIWQAKVNRLNWEPGKKACLCDVSRYSRNVIKCLRVDMQLDLSLSV